MKIAVLTSSRADYGIYRPLLKRLHADPGFDLSMIVFGTHLSAFHGYTITEIEQDGYKIEHKISTVLASDSAESIASSMALTSMKFVNIWQQIKNDYDLVFCLGDRYEMFAAVSASVPFNIKIAHIHGGETTTGAIDNKFRHCLSLFSDYHFVTTETYAKRVSRIIGSEKNIYNVGSLSLQNINDITLLTKEEFKLQFGINIELPTVLVTFHPETVAADQNLIFVKELIAAMDELEEQIIITMPNTDTMGNVLRKEYNLFADRKKNVVIVENFGTKGYFSCMKYAEYLLGNSSSAIIEAASFSKYIINVGDRQKGRSVSGNVINVPARKSEILAACKQLSESELYKGPNVYFKENPAEAILDTLRMINNDKH